MKNIAMRIDIETELNAINSGQCGSCRLGLTHQPSEPCYKYQDNYAKMNHCPKCNHLYSSIIFSHCPICIKEDI